ncbi:hypothetical protein DP73_03735 [Desulfosporosinus sp. HMP52]|uniref:DUF3102 domain-containing protein n=1 Tax=Desulfosporosinus sp. HMP52 TaxID=1487923 RepID=UPI00051FEE69|nr:DUF3102 domain-containing protein [Desulfosporosinus sp. HMP52]KGK91389.1 hypothetical protein DP73_03735 [Desulfosporosinus sp. HMP52]
MNDLISDRNPLVIAAEINTIKYQTRKVLLASAIEIGRRLKEAKELLPHGEWGKWLVESCSYSKKTAEKLLRIFDAYGTQEPPNLNFTQAYILLGVPEEERAQFMAEIDVEGLSTRELQKAVKERSQALQERDQALQEKTELRQALSEQESQITQLTTERNHLKTKAEQLSKSQGEQETKAVNLEKKLESLKKSTSYEGLQKINKNLIAAQHKTNANQIAFLYESLDKTFKQLVWELSSFADKDKDTYEVYKSKVLDFLTKGLKETI